MSNFLDSYNQHVAERANLGVLPLPINLAQAEKIFTMLRAGEGQTAQLIELVENRFTMGGGAENLLRVQFLSDVIAGSVHVDGYSAQRALGLLRHTGTAGLKVLADLVLSGSQEAANELKLVPSLDVWGKLAENAQDPLVRQVLESFIQREWETQFPTPTEVKVSLLFITKPDGTVVLRITTDDYSQASHSSTRPDTALHSEQCLTGINPELLDYMKQYVCALIAGIQGEGSSRETGVEAPQRWMGEAIEYQANTWAGGIFIGEGKDGMFPIFAENLFNGGALGVCIDDVMSLFPYNRQEITIRPYDGEILAENGDVIATFTLDENQLGAYRVRSGIFWQEAQEVTKRAQALLYPVVETVQATRPMNAVYQMYAKAAGLPYVEAGQVVTIKVDGAFWQETTGGLNRKAAIKFSTEEFAVPVWQSTCHTDFAPNTKEVENLRLLREYHNAHGGTMAREQDGIVHSFANILVKPYGIYVISDSHGRPIIGYGLPSGSNQVAYGSKNGFVTVTVPEVVEVNITDDGFNPGIHWRDLVHYIPMKARELGLLTDNTNVFNNRVMLITGVENLNLHDAFQQTDASAERATRAALFQSSEGVIRQGLEANIKMIDSMLANPAYNNRSLNMFRAAQVEWLENPYVLRNQEGCNDIVETIYIRTSEIKQPVVALPGNPDDVCYLDDVPARLGLDVVPVGSVGMGSCMATPAYGPVMAAMLNGVERAQVDLFVSAPTRMHSQYWKHSGAQRRFFELQARLGGNNCLFCMGNQVKLPDGPQEKRVEIVMGEMRTEDATVNGITFTRNFNGRCSAKKNGRDLLVSPEVAGSMARLGRVPTYAEHLAIYNEHVAPNAATLYDAPYFTEMPA